MNPDFFKQWEKFYSALLDFLEIKKIEWGAENMLRLQKISEHFSYTENYCKCGCGQDTVVMELYDMAEALRAHIGKPMITHCVNRCEKHNAAVGGAKNSYHLKGMAMDFHCAGITVAELHVICSDLWKKKEILTGGYGLYTWGAHIDTANYRTWTG